MRDEVNVSVGRRLAEIRAWRKLSLRAVAELAGFSASHLSRIENEHQPVDKRSTLEALARALRVSPAELGAPSIGRRTDPELAEATAALADVECALTDVGFGEAVGSPRPWPAVAADVAHLNEVLHPAGDYGAEVQMFPTLIRELNAHVHASPDVRRDVLVALMGVYQDTAIVTKYLGARGLPAMAAMYARQVAEELDLPVWIGLATWTRSLTLGAGRERMRDLSLSAADDLECHAGADRDARELYGALHLNAAMASAALQDADSAAGHVAEAQATAESMEERPGTGFGHILFGRMNVRFWQVAIAVEQGESGRVLELRSQITPELVPSICRQSVYWADLGRGLVAIRASREDAVEALVRAERLAPVKTRANPYVREAVADLLRRVRRDDTAGRELRGMAYRMGVAG